ncbi:MAG: head GIN domain-containing protein [Flavobacteriaceae bacterium]
MKSIFILLSLIFGHFIFAQTTVKDSVSVQENKQIERSKTIMMSPFSGIKVFSGIQVKLIPSAENKLILSGENFETVVTTLKKDVLRIKHSLDQIFNPKNTYIEIYFTQPLDLIHTYQGSIVETKAVLKTTSIELKAHEGSSIEVNLECEKIKSSVNSGATLNIEGSTVNHELKILGGGICESETLLTKQTTVKVTAGGVAYIHASDLLEATVNVGGTVRIHGRPTKLIKTKRIGGTITEMN